uniref:Uncharacterized protein, isoform B n=1 Tax=Drosophila melanogaster TaxID=7227 RepID=X2JB70_DROME|nr:uncharacterized protein Dmel_CG31600, isoform B [Drosophila melanogaster]AHN54642.1 uncharacterized protein Dmel_CG31600, isoform B [Drosophila melanogaster]|eukprot:NP_001286128.1 uncharacterized protein Dmel_CG31600, isoform B [Drosophila melanogaster]
MVEGMIKKLTAILFGLVLAVLFRVIIPFTLRLKSAEITINVLNCFNFLTSTVSITICLNLVSLYLANLRDDWLVLGILVLHWTYFTISKQLEAMNRSYSTFMDSLNLKWLAYSNFNETDWPSIENAVLCCGLEGPRSYMDYLQGVPTHCYHPDLITQGCSDFVKNIFMPIQHISHLQLRLAIFVELVILLILAATLLKKCISLIGERKHKRVITHGLAVLIDLVKNTF